MGVGVCVCVCACVYVCMHVRVRTRVCVCMGSAAQKMSFTFNKLCRISRDHESMCDTYIYTHIWASWYYTHLLLNDANPSVSILSMIMVLSSCRLLCRLNVIFPSDCFIPVTISPRSCVYFIGVYTTCSVTAAVHNPCSDIFYVTYILPEHNSKQLCVWAWYVRNIRRYVMLTWTVHVYYYHIYCFEFLCAFMDISGTWYLQNTSIVLIQMRYVCTQQRYTQAYVRTCMHAHTRIHTHTRAVTLCILDIGVSPEMANTHIRTRTCTLTTRTSTAHNTHHNKNK